MRLRGRPAAQSPPEARGRKKKSHRSATLRPRRPRLRLHSITSQPRSYVSRGGGVGVLLTCSDASTDARALAGSVEPGFFFFCRFALLAGGEGEPALGFIVVVEGERRGGQVAVAAAIQGGTPLDGIDGAVRPGGSVGGGSEEGGGGGECETHLDWILWEDWVLCQKKKVRPARELGKRSRDLVE